MSIFRTLAAFFPIGVFLYFELFLAFALFFCRMERRSRFGGRVALSLALSALWSTAVLFAEAAAINAIQTLDIPDNELRNVCLSAVNIAAHLMVFGGFVAAAFFCFHDAPGNVFFFGSSACSLQLSVYALSTVIGNLIVGVNMFFLRVAVVPVLYAAAFLAFYRRLGNLTHEQELSPHIIRTMFAVVLIIAAASESFAFIFNQSSPILYTLMSLCAFFCGFIVLFMQYFFLDYVVKLREANTASLIDRLGERLYKASKENNEILNIKVHDLKHQLALWERQGEGEEKQAYLQELRASIAAYESAVETGYEILDVILTNKSLLCMHSGIELTCLVDGQCLRFMEVSDIYSLFGNALDNAIEYVGGLDEDKRIVKLYTKREGGSVYVTCVNYYEGGPLRLEEGLPVTSKKNAQEHGFGMKSMRRVAQKYGGTFSAAVEGESFVIRIVIPVRG